MVCSLCLDTTSALQTIGANGRCPRCGTDYSAFVHISSAPALETPYNLRTRKLMVRGDAYRDRLVAARLSLRSNL